MKKKEISTQSHSLGNLIKVRDDVVRENFDIVAVSEAKIYFPFRLI